MALEIRLLGELAVVRQGRAVDLPASRRTRALLGYLAATARPHRRSQLCDLLWEGPDDPRAALRWSLAKLRPLVDDEGAQRLVADRERVALEPQGAVIDVAAVRATVGADPAAAAVETLRAAAARFRGEFLDGLELADCFRYHQWCAAEREACRALRGAILQALVARVPSPEEALAHAREWVAVDPLREAAHAALIRALGATGRVRDGLAQYDACVRLLGEVGARPTAELEQARRALGRPVAVAPVPAPAGAPAPFEPAPFVGRRTEWAELQAAAARAARGDTPRVSLITGEPGIGKTRLLDALAEEVRRLGGRVMRGRAFEAEGVRAYGAWIDALRSLPVADASAGLTADLAPLLPELEPGAPAGGDRSRLFDAVVALLRRVAEAQPPLAVILDDVHWLDEASLALIHFAARALDGAPVLLAGGARPGELFDNAAALRLSRALAREARLSELPLSPLDEEDTARLARSISPAVNAGRVFAESHGHPLLALEVARALETGEETLSESLSGLIEDRLQRLDEPARELLPWMAALGRGFSLDLLAEVASTPAPRLLEAVAVLERHRLLREGREGAHTVYEFVHDLVRTAAYRRMSEPRRRLVHAHIARVLSALPDPDGMRSADVAHHAGLAGDHALCTAACRSAGERFLRMFAYAEAAELSDRGLAHAAHLPPRERIEFSIGLRRLRIHSAMTPGEGERIEPALQELVREADALQLPDQVRNALEALTFVNWYTGNFSRAHSETLRHADVSRAASPEEAAQGLANAARCLGHLERDPLRAQALVLEAQQIAGPAATDILDLVWARGLLHRYQGDYDAAVDCLQRALSLGRARGDRYSEWDCLARLAMVELERGRPPEALERCRAMEPLLSQMSEGSEPAFSAALLALARDANGEAASADVEQAIEDLARLDSRWMVAYARATAAALDLERGQAERARERARLAIEAAETVDRRSEAAVARALLARLAFSEGDVDQARKWLHAHDIDLERGVLSARARTALAEAAAAMGERIPTLATTVPTTAPS